MTLRKRTRSVLAAAATVGVLLMLQGPASASDDTTALLRQMFNNNQYPDLLPKLNAALASTMGPADVANHYDLLVLKGETLLRTHSYEGARDAFRAASIVKTDKKKARIAEATAELIKRSDSGKYQSEFPSDAAKPAAQPPAPIDIVETDSRKSAFNALFADLLANAKPDLDQCESTASLSPIIAAAGDISYARPIELAGTDDDKQSVDQLKKLADQANTLMTAALKKLDAKISTVSKASGRRNKVTRFGTVVSSGRTTDANSLGGLSSVVTQARQIAAATVKMESIFQEIGDFKTVETAANKTANDANALLVKNHYPPVN